MRIGLEQSGSLWTFDFVAEPGDPLVHQRKGMRQRRARVVLPMGTQGHPELSALAAALIAAPFAASVTYGWAISPRLAKALEVYFEKPFGPSDPTVSPRARPADKKPGLAFSGGVDSFAVLDLLPDAELFHLMRIEGDGDDRPSARSQEAALAACTAVDTHRTFVVPTDLEYVRNPIGFPDHMACAVPMILMAADRRLDAAAFGTIGEAAYRYGVDSFMDYDARPLARQINGMFEAVGLPVLNPVAAVSEVVTTTIVSQGRYQSIASSCGAGRLDPCWACKKCLRKALTLGAVTGQWPEAERLDRLFAAPGVRTYLSGLPIKLENVLAWALGRYEGDHPLLSALKVRVRRDDMDWMEAYLPRALEDMPANYRDEVRTGLQTYTRAMTPEQEAAMMRWSARKSALTRKGRERHAAFLRRLE